MKIPEPGLARAAHDKGPSDFPKSQIERRDRICVNREAIVEMCLCRSDIDQILSDLDLDRAVDCCIVDIERVLEPDGVHTEGASHYCPVEIYIRHVRSAEVKRAIDASVHKNNGAEDCVSEIN